MARAQPEDLSEPPPAGPAERLAETPPGGPAERSAETPPAGSAESPPTGLAEQLAESLAAWSRELDWFDPLTETIFVRIHLIARHSSGNRRAVLGADGLRLWQYKILMTLRRRGRPYTASPSELADQLGLTRGALSARLGILERAGWIVREHEGDDRRRVRVMLTGAGLTTLDSAMRQEGQGEGRLLTPLSVQERQTLAELLGRVLFGADRPAGSPAGPCSAGGAGDQPG